MRLSLLKRLIREYRISHFLKVGTALFFILTLVSLDVFRGDLAQAATFTWTQSSWAGGLDGGTRPVHPTNQSDWAKYESKDSSVNVGAAGVAMATTSLAYVAQTSDIDFGAGSHSTTTVVGTGSAAMLSLANNLAGYWHFDESSGARADSTGNGNTLTESSAVGSTAGVLSNAANFSGSNYFTKADNASLSPTTAASWSFWINPRALGGSADMIASKWAYNLTYGWGIRTNGTEIEAMFENGTVIGITSGLGLANSTWYHVAVVFDGGRSGNVERLKIYVNGSNQDLSYSGTVPASLTDTSTAFEVGGWSNVGYYWNGYIDEFGFWNRALSVSEIGLLYAAGTFSLSGSYTSSVLDAGAGNSFSIFSYDQTTPVSTSLTMDVRTGNTSSPDGTWSSWQTSVASGVSLAALGDNRYLQYRASLTTTNVLVTPTLNEVSVSYLPAPASLISSVYDSTDANNLLTQISWTAATTSEATVKFQIRTAPDSAGAPGTFTEWKGPDNTSNTYFTNNAGGDSMPSSLSDGLNDQWLQYKAIFSTTDAAQSAVLRSVVLRYVVNTPPDFDSNYPTASAGGVSAVQNADGTVTVGYSVRDQDSTTGSFTPGYVTPSFEYSLNGGSSWTAIASEALGVTATTDKAVDQTSYTTYTATWYASSSAPSTFASSTKVRVTVNDNEGAHNTTQQASAAFALDTTAPAVGTYRLNVGAGTISLAITDNSLISYRLSNNADQSADGLNVTSGAWQAVGASSTTATINWTFTGSYPTVYLQTKDTVSNQTNQTAVAPKTPQSYELRDISNVTNSEYKELVDWSVYSADAGASFGSYNIYRSTNGGATFSLLTSITDQNLNYFIDTSLSTSTTYTYKVQVSDTDGDSSSFTPAASDLPNGQGGTDVSPPSITSVTSSSTQSTSVVISWTTDELSNSVVEYSTDSSFGLSRTVDTMVVSHSVTITSLSPSTTYYYRVRSADIFSNAAVDSNGGSGYTFLTGSGPVISNVTTPLIGDTTATISWDTNLDSSSIVVYADNSILSNPQQAGSGSLVGGADGAVVFQHRVELSGLTAGRTYYYYVRSTDGDGNVTNENNSGNYYSFHTSQDVNGPVISNVETPIVGSAVAIVVWQTDELATSQVAYGTASGTLSTLTTLDPTLSIYHIATISDLTEASDYYYAVHSRDQAANETVGSVESFTTVQSTDALVAAARTAASGGGGGAYFIPDSTPPSIGELEVKDIGPFDATVNWRTDKQVRSFVELTDSRGKVVTFGSATPTVNTSIHLVNLRLGDSYSFIAKSIDANGNFAVAPRTTFKTKFVVEKGDEEAQLSDATDLQDRLSDVIESSLPSLLPPVISDIAISDVTERSAKITWKTNIKGSSLVGIAKKGEYHEDTDKPYPVEQSGQEDAVKDHSVDLVDLEPNTLYNYQVRTKTLVGTLGKSPNKTFSTKAGRVKATISGLTSTSFIVSWATPEPTTSVVEYKNKETGAVNKKSDSAMATRHEITIDNVSQGAKYDVIVSGVNAEGNVLSGEPVPVTITRDVSAPVISNFKVESFMVPGRADRIQTVVSWQTDEPANSVVEYNEGIGNAKGSFQNRYEDLKNLTSTHTVALLNLKPETVYELQAISTDQFGNKTVFGPRTVITPKQAQSIVDVIFGNFNDTFKFIKNINP